VVAYAVIRGRGHDSRLMILEDKRQEMLGAIDPTEVGYEDMASFRRAWMRGEVRKFRPLTKVFVYTVRPFGEGDREEMALAIFDRLYGEFRDGDRALVS
jgi:hypothetical protein